jgi:hypothetical protein
LTRCCCSCCCCCPSCYCCCGTVDRAQTCAFKRENDPKMVCTPSAANRSFGECCSSSISEHLSICDVCHSHAHCHLMRRCISTPDNLCWQLPHLSCTLLLALNCLCTAGVCLLHCCLQHSLRHLGVARRCNCPHVTLCATYAAGHFG